MAFIPVFHEDFQVSSHSSFLLGIFARWGGSSAWAVAKAKVDNSKEIAPLPDSEVGS